MKTEKFKVTPLERAWILYDVGNSAFVLMIATLVPIFFNALAEAGGVSKVDYLAYWGYASSIVTVVTAILGPILGTLADTKGFKKPIFMLCLFVGGIGCCAYRQGNLMVGAVVACNAMGDVWDHGQIIAGARNDENTGFANAEEWLIAHGERQLDVFSEKFVGQNTVIGCVVTNAALTKPQTAKLAAVAQNGIARAVRPANATFDGDSMCAMACGSVAADPDAVGILAARAVEEAICRGVRAAESLHGRPAIRDLPFGKDKNS